MNILRHRRIISTLCAIAFAILASISASHLHIGADQDEACAVCAAFAGKLEGPAAKLSVPAGISVGYLESESRPEPQLQQPLVVVLPPSCGPPRVA